MSSHEIASQLPQSDMLINFAGREDAFTHHLFFDIAPGKLPNGLYRNKIVLIIPSANPDEKLSTPVGPMYEGYIQANAVATILDRSPLRAAGNTINNLALLFVVLLTAVVASRRGLWQSAAGSGALALGLAVSAAMLFALDRLWIDTATPEVAIVLSFTSVMALRVGAGERQRRRAMQLLVARQRRHIESTVGPGKEEGATTRQKEKVGLP